MPRFYFDVLHLVVDDDASSLPSADEACAEARRALVEMAADWGGGPLSITIATADEHHRVICRTKLEMAETHPDLSAPLSPRPMQPAADRGRWHEKPRWRPCKHRRYRQRHRCNRQAVKVLCTGLLRFVRHVCLLQWRQDRRMLAGRDNGDNL